MSGTNHIPGRTLRKWRRTNTGRKAPTSSRDERHQPRRQDNRHLPNTGIVTAQKGTKILRNNEGRFLEVWKELCYGKAETLEDAEIAVRGWRYNLVR